MGPGAVSCLRSWGFCFLLPMCRRMFFAADVWRCASVMRTAWPTLANLPLGLTRTSGGRIVGFSFSSAGKVLDPSCWTDGTGDGTSAKRLGSTS